MASIEIRNTINEVVTRINDGKIDSTSTSIYLFGKGTEKYLKELNENFFRLLENFASKKAPKKPMVGQVWYAKKGSNIVEARGTGLNYNASRYVKINGVKLPVRNRRGIALVIFDNNFKDKIKSITYYDIYGSNSARTQLARKLGTIKDDEMFVMVSYDAIGTNHELNKMMEKLGSKAWYKIKRRWRYPYAAIGTGKFGIISEDLKGYNERKHAYAQVAFESLKPEEGMGYHTALLTPSSPNDNLLVWNGQYWESNAETIEGKTLDDLRRYILSGVNLGLKYDISGGVVNGSIYIKKSLIPYKNIKPTGNEIQDLGNVNKRWRRIHLSENATIKMGADLEFNKHSFVYTVEKDTDSVSHVPSGALILNRATGEAIIKKDNFNTSLQNSNFRQLSNYTRYVSVIGGNNYNFKGDTGIFMGSWNHNKIQSIKIPTPHNAKYFGTCRPGGRSAGASDATRGLSFYQHPYGNIQYVTISTPMNAINFGSYSGGEHAAASSDGVRAVVFGGRNSNNRTYYVRFATPMNAIEYGTIGVNCYWGSSVSDGVRAIFDRGDRGWNNQEYRYFSISTPSNSIHFGKMQFSRGSTGATSNGIYGLWMGGWRPGHNYTDIERLILETPHNSTHFGDLTYARHTTAPVANDSYAVATSGNKYIKTLDYIGFANGSKSAKFGDAVYPIRFPASFSGN